jgi:hypothetical protein
MKSLRSLEFPGFATTSVVVTVNSRAFVSPGSDFSVPVEISEVSDFDASTFEITFDPSVLELVRVSQGLIGSTEIRWTFSMNQPGHYSVIVNINDIQPPLEGATGSALWLSFISM